MNKLCCFYKIGKSQQMDFIISFIESLDMKQSGSCPLASCKANLDFASDATVVQCNFCGNQHKKETIKDVTSFHQSKTSGDIKVNGISSYMCKLLSPLLTRYGMMKDTGEAKLLSKMGKGEIFDCSRLSNRAFLIEPCNLSVPRYGYDSTGSRDYLAETLHEIESVNANDTRLVPIHADGDGHCLVHAISRALVGRELFWHTLRANLQIHFHKKLSLYKMQFRDFINDSEWQVIIDECKPDFVPREGEQLGLRNIHIFGLANVLRRPIVLLDSIVGMNSSGDYSGVFLPKLCSKEECLDKDDQLNKPLCIAWSNSGRNHYIPLVGIEGKPPPRLPRSMLQKAWGVDVYWINEYIDFDENDCCTIGGNKLGDRYIRKLIEAMEKVYYENNSVQPSLVADTYQLLRKSPVIDSMKPDEVMLYCKQLIQQCQLYRCLNCNSLNKVNMPQTQMDVLVYSCMKDLLLQNVNNSNLIQCENCQVLNELRLVEADGKVCYVNGDQVSTPHGSKYYWDGTFYNNLPQILPLKLKWKTKDIVVKVAWFENESDASLNSNAFEIGQRLVLEHFPGEFNTETLENSLVNQILELTKIKDVRLLAAAHSQVEGMTEKGFCTELQSDVLSKKKKILMQTLEAAKEQQSQPMAGDSQQSKQIPSEMIENLCGIVDKLEPDQLPPQEDVMETALIQKSIQTQSATPKSSPSKTQSPLDAQMKCSPTKSIRLSTSTGQKVLLSLEKDVTFEELQDLITKEFGVPATRQKIRMGFPPRELCPNNNIELVPLKHLDRVEVEVLPEEGYFDADSLNSLRREALFQSEDIWSYVQKYPDFFRKGGIIYCQMQKRKHEFHFTIPLLPEKTFCYNEITDIVQICLKAYGHFNVEPGIEWKVQQIRPNLILPCQYHMTHSSNQVHSRHQKSQLLFSGQGQSLMSQHREAKLSVSSSKKDLPSMGSDAECKNISPYQKLGPGFSILGGKMSNVTNTSLEKIQALAANIDPHLDFNREQDDLQEDKQNPMETT